MRTRISSIIALLLGLGSSVCAQVAVRPQFETAEQARQPKTLPPNPAREGVAMVNDQEVFNPSGDLGEQWIFQAKEKPQAFAASAEVSALYTSNVALTAQNETEDTYLLSQVSVSWQHLLAGGVNIDATLQQAFFRYNDFSTLNFDSLNLGVGLSRQIESLGNTLWSVRYNFNRLTAENLGEQLYTSHSLLLAAQKVFQLTRADAIFLGASVQQNFADPNDLERGELGVFGGYTLAITRSISCDAVYRAAIYAYDRADRTDFNQSLALSLRWHPLEWLALSGSASGSINRSDASAFDYDLFNGGVAVSLSCQF